MNYFIVFLVSMIPILELRAAIPLACGFGIPWYIAYMLCAMGNFLPVPFIMLFIRRILKWMKNIKHLDKFAYWLEEHARKHGTKIAKYEALGLFFFVSLPIPGTGGWTGALIASMLDIRMKYALPAIFAGLLAAGFIMTGISYGFLQIFSLFA